MFVKRLSLEANVHLPTGCLDSPTLHGWIYRGHLFSLSLAADVGEQLVYQAWVNTL
jgi:hypothetical protein